jgi:LAS superfamily LD-carboxypeptidase LdcB
MQNKKTIILYISIFIFFILNPIEIYALDNRGCPNSYAELQSVSGHKELLAEVARERGYTDFNDAGKIDSSAMSALAKMKEAAKKEGKNINEISGYRSYNDQVGTFFDRSNVTNPITRCYTGPANRDEVKRQYLARGEASAPPGFSEHHSGKAFDFNSVERTFENTPEFKWLESNASKYGFRLSYPKNSTKGAGYEPWHWYYTGGGINEDTVNNSDESATTVTDSSTPGNSATTAGTVSYESYTNFPGVGRISSLCQLITAMWYLGFAVLLTSVLGMFLWGGYIYVTAGVNAGKVNEAKEIFTNTITGLIIGLSIFIIINIINPGLLQGNCSIPSVGSGATLGEDSGAPVAGNGSQSLLEVARRNSVGKRPDGRCYQHVANYIDQAGFCGIKKNGFNAAIPAGYYLYAKNFAEYLNQGDNASRLGIVKLPIDNPYRAPAGSIVVVRPNSPGTRHPTAGDIVVADGKGNFYNGGEMGYGGSQNFPPGNNYVLGVYACK